MKETMESLSSCDRLNNFAKFKEYLPDVQIKEININDIPKEALDFFIDKGMQFADPDRNEPNDFKKFLVLEYGDNDHIYVAIKTKNYSLGEEDDVEESTYFFDIKENKSIGYSEIRYKEDIESEYFKDKPFIGIIRTDKALKTTGLGTRRMNAMNAISRMLYNLPLYSDTVNSPEMKSLWEGLVEKNKAEKFKEDENDRYFMKE